MSWQERVTDAVIETAAGDRFVFEFKDIPKKREERTEITEFSNTQDYVQRKVSGSETFEIILWLSGPDCDETADLFEEATRDPRALRFTHPLKKRTYLVQLLSLGRNDNLATKANEVAFILSLHETIDLENIISPENAERFVDNTVNEMNLQNSDYFKNKITDKPKSLIDKVKAGIKAATAAVATASVAYDYAADTLADFESIKTQANNLVDTVTTNAEAVADVTAGLIQFSAKAILDPLEKLAFFNDMIDELNDLLADTDNNDPDAVLLIGLSTLGGLAQASIRNNETNYETKTAVFAQSEKIYSVYNSLVVFIEALEDDGFEMTPEVKKQAEKLVALAAGKLSEIAFKTKQERTYVAEKNEDLFPLVYKLLGGDDPDDFDNKIDKFIAINKLGGRELFEIRQGRALKYYV